MKRGEQVNKPVGTRALAKILGVQPSAVTKAYKQSRITPAFIDQKGRPQYDPTEARRQWLANTAPQDSTGRHAIKPADDDEEAKRPENASDVSRYNKARADKEEALAETACLELDALKKKLLSADEIGLVWTQLLKGASQKLSGLPVHMLSRFPGLTDEGREYMVDRLREILDDLAAWEPGAW